MLLSEQESKMYKRIKDNVGYFHNNGFNFIVPCEHIHDMDVVTYQINVVNVCGSPKGLTVQEDSSFFKMTFILFAFQCVVSKIPSVNHSFLPFLSTFMHVFQYLLIQSESISMNLNLSYEFEFY